MATKKQKRQALRQRYEERMEALRLEGLEAQRKSRERREAKAAEAKKFQESEAHKKTNIAAAALIHKETTR
jgi:hypothetical protein